MYFVAIYYLVGKIYWTVTLLSFGNEDFLCFFLCLSNDDRYPRFYDSCLFYCYFSRVSPKNCTWSYEMLVIILSSGIMTLVESRRPPMPTSTMAMSTLFLLK